MQSNTIFQSTNFLQSDTNLNHFIEAAEQVLFSKKHSEIKPAGEIFPIYYFWAQSFGNQSNFNCFSFTYGQHIQAFRPDNLF